MDDMIEDMILSISISAHREIKRSRDLCGICNTQCALPTAHMCLMTDMMIVVGSM